MSNEKEIIWGKNLAELEAKLRILIRDRQLQGKVTTIEGVRIGNTKVGFYVTEMRQLYRVRTMDLGK